MTAGHLLRRTLAAWLFCLCAGAAAAASFAEAERDVQIAPKRVLAEVQTQLKATSLGDGERARWLAIGSEAAYALALPDLATGYAKDGLGRMSLSPELKQRLSIAYAQGLDLAGQSKESIELLMTVVATLETEAFAPQYLVDALNARASAYYSTSDYRAALADLLRVYPMAPEHGERTIRADVANALGNVYAALEDYPHAEPFYLETIEYSVANQTWVRASIAEFSLASVYRRDKQWDKAATYFERSREHSLQADDQQGVAYAEYGLAQVALELEQFDKAEGMYRHALPVFVDAGDLLPQANISRGLAKIAFERKQYPQALSHIAAALALVDKIADVELKHRLLSLRAETEYAKGDYREAYLSLQQSAAAKQELMKARANESLSEMRVRFDSERQEQENALLLKENQLNAAQIAEQKQTTRLYIVSVVALLLILGVLVLLAHRSKQLRLRLAAQALTDELTGVANRRHTMQVLAAEFERARRYRTVPLVIAVFDLDHFKQINDRFGHAAGDQVLVMFARAMADSLRKTDCFGRVGGEEFLAILPHTGSEEASVVLERMRYATLALNCAALGGELQPSVSIGYCQLSEDDKSIEELVKRADDAVYAAKEAGRNRVVLG